MGTFLQGSLQRWKLEFGLDLPPSSGNREALQYLMMARLAVLYVVLGGIVLNQVFRGTTVLEQPLYYGYAILALSYFFNLAQSIWLHRLPTHFGLALVNIAFDSVAISGWILFSSVASSLFALLYLVQILFAALTFYKRGAFFGAALACVGFGMVCWLRPLQEGWLIWVIYSALFVTLGMVGGYLSEELLRTTESLREESGKIEKLQRFYEQVINNLPTGLLTVDGLMRVNFLNPAAEHILGRRMSDIVGQSLAEVDPGLLPFFSQIEAEDLAEDETDPLSDEGTALARTRSEFHTTHFFHPRSNEKTRLQQTVEVGHGARVRLLRGDVAELDADAPLGKLLESADHKGAKVLLFQDVTKLVHLEDKLKQNEKLAAIGQLAAGIAHEIRNPLASMSGSIQMLRSSMIGTDASENSKLMDIAVREIDRLNNLISEFLDFVKPVRLKIESVSLPKLCSDLVLQLRSSKDFRQGIELTENYGGQVSASANSEKLKQVLWNLLVNALQAMEGKGRIEVGCSVAGGHRVKLWVEDQGQGMSEDVLAHLYEPFFTTKERGTGLGLATAYKIIEALHGEIRVKSKPQVGTRFEIVLPRA